MSKIALYLRLSVDEANTDESNSIINQRLLLSRYLDQSPEFQTFQREEFVDDGFSGTSTNRPAFQRLMADVKAGIICHILVKDLSRFMRDYLELGNYLENIFPFLGVRFIALNDQYDSKTSEKNGLEIDVPFRNLLNDFYAKDVSEKVKSAMNTMKRSGKNMSWLPPFGYLKDPEDRFKIVIDEEVAPIVRRIFRLSIEGMGDQKIAQLLNREQTITPAERKMQVSQAKYQKTMILTDEQTRNVWTKGSVRQILKNEAYKGTYLFNTRTYIRGRLIRRPESKWERIENNHEAIVSAEVFEKAQQARLFRRGIQSSSLSQKTEKSIVTGLVFCEHCGHRLSLRQNKGQIGYFYCGYCKGQDHSVSSCRLDKIEASILEALSGYLESPAQSKANTEISRDIERLKTRKLELFQEYKDCYISSDVYLDKKVAIDEQVTNLEKSFLVDQKPQSSTKGLTKEIVEAHVEKIVVDCLGFFEVIYKS
ncbi:recombinase family protein [Streptococcus sp. ZY19097]|uniref:recombinase family protein n=1 Tax=Streptococcus sp. ZY19097 TaxID=3231906 RepID=UPI00345AEF08